MPSVSNSLKVSKGPRQITGAGVVWKCTTCHQAIRLPIDRRGGMSVPTCPQCQKVTESGMIDGIDLLIPSAAGAAAELIHNRELIWRLLMAMRVRNGQGEFTTTWCLSCVNDVHSDVRPCACACHIGWAFLERLKKDEEERAA